MRPLASGRSTLASGIHEVMRYVVELIGAFFLVFTIGNTVLAPKDAGDLAPLAIGATPMGMIFAGGHVSGAHYNPAATLAVFLRGKCPAADVVLRRLERGHRQGDRGELVLWAGDRVYRAGGRVFGWRHFWRSRPPGGGGRHPDSET